MTIYALMVLLAWVHFRAAEVLKLSAMFARITGIIIKQILTFIFDTLTVSLRLN